MRTTRRSSGLVTRKKADLVNLDRPEEFLPLLYHP